MPCTHCEDPILQAVVQIGTPELRVVSDRHELTGLAEERVSRDGAADQGAILALLAGATVENAPVLNDEDAPALHRHDLLELTRVQQTPELQIRRVPRFELVVWHCGRHPEDLQQRHSDRVDEKSLPTITLYMGDTSIATANFERRECVRASSISERPPRIRARAASARASDMLLTTFGTFCVTVSKTVPGIPKCRFQYENVKYIDFREHSHLKSQRQNELYPLESQKKKHISSTIDLL